MYKINKTRIAIIGMIGCVLMASAQSKQLKTYSEDVNKVEDEYGIMDCKETYTYYVDELGNYVRHGNYKLAGSHLVENNSSWRRHYFKSNYNATATFKDGWLNGLLTVTMRSEFTTTDGGVGVTVDKLTANYKDGIPHGAWKYARTFPKENNRTGVAITMNFNHGMLVGDFLFNEMGRTSGTFSSEGEYSGVWKQKDVHGNESEITFMDGVVLSWFDRKNGQITNKDEQVVGLKDLARRFANNEITEDELYEQGYIVRKNALFGGDNIWRVLYRDNILNLNAIGGDKTNVANATVKCEMGKPFRRLHKVNVPSKELIDDFVWLLEKGGEDLIGTYATEKPADWLLCELNRLLVQNRVKTISNVGNWVAYRDKMLPLLREEQRQEWDSICNYLDTIYRRYDGLKDYFLGASNSDYIYFNDDKLYLREMDMKRLKEAMMTGGNYRAAIYEQCRSVNDSIFQVELQAQKEAEARAKAEAEARTVMMKEEAAKKATEDVLTKIKDLFADSKALRPSGAEVVISKDMNNNLSAWKQLFADSDRTDFNHAEKKDESKLIKQFFSDTPIADYFHSETSPFQEAVKTQLKPFCPMLNYEILSVRLQEESNKYIVTCQSEKYAGKKKRERYQFDLVIVVMDDATKRDVEAYVGGVLLRESFDFSKAVLLESYQLKK